MTSLRKILHQCLDLTGEIKINRDMYGYRHRDANGRIFGELESGDLLPISKDPSKRSLLDQLKLIKGKSINFTIFLVGAKEVDDTSLVTLEHRLIIQYAIQATREIYSQADLGIRKISWQPLDITAVQQKVKITDNAKFFNNATSTPPINKRDEIRKLAREFSGAADSIDVFYVQDIPGAWGFNQSGGLVVEVEPQSDLGKKPISLKRRAGLLLAHELGHHLGAQREGNSDNLMGTDDDGDGVDLITNDSIKISSEQKKAILSSNRVQGAISIS